MKDNTRKLILVSLWLLFVTLAVYVNYFRSINVAYTHLFYILIFLTGIWYPSYTIVTGIILGLLHIGIDFMDNEIIGIPSFIRATIMVFVSFMLFRLKEQLHQVESFKTFIDNSNDVICTLDEKGYFVYVSPKIEELLFIPPNQLTGKHFSEASCNPDNGNRKILQQLTPQKPGPLNFEFQAKLPNGTYRWISSNISLLQYEKKWMYLISSRDITDQKEEMNVMEYVMYHDQLTGLYNRRFYEKELLRLDREHHYPLSVIMMDVNGLKMANDAFGHKVGDMLLIRLANTLSMKARSTDVVARISGDEFIILLPETSIEFASSLAKAIYDDFSGEKIGSINPSVSYGVDAKMTKEEDIYKIIQRAESQMYRMKLSESSSARYRTLGIIMQTMYEKNPMEKKHAENVAAYAEKIGIQAGIPREQLEELKTAAHLHDIGKISIDRSILDKTEPLNSSDWNEIHLHPETGYRILNCFSEFSTVAAHVLQHHEKWDGKGYPKGLSGEDISLEARIISLAETYDILSNGTHYQEVKGYQEIVAELKKESGKSFDPGLVELMLVILAEEEERKESKNEPN